MKTLSYAQRLALMVHAASTMEARVSFPYDFKEYAKAESSCKMKKISYYWN